MNKNDALEKILQNIKLEDNNDRKIIDYQNSYININFDNDNFLFCLKNLTWKEAIDIESKSYRSDNNELVFNSEFEKRYIIKKSLKWIYDIKNKTQYDEDLDYLLSQIKHEVMENVWQEYYKNNYLTANEVSFYHEAANRYFDNENINGFPVPPIIIEVGMMMKNIISFSRDEFSKLSMKEFEIIKLISSLYRKK
jgi:hypothetical protein